MYFIECENSDVFNSRDESKFSFYFIFFRRFTVTRVTMFRTKRKGLFVTEYLDQLSYTYYD